MDWLVLTLATITAVIGNLSLKKGMLEVGQFNLPKKEIISSLVKVFFNPFIFWGLFLYIVSMIFWLKTLSLFEISKAYPILVGISFILVTIGSYFFFKETLPSLKILGIIIIFFGVLVIAKS